MTLPDPASGLTGLSTRRALVTGASRGIGRAIALKLIEEGADVVIAHLNDAQKAQEVLDAGACAAFDMDLTADGAPSALVDAGEGAVGGAFEILVLNAAGEARADWRAISLQAADTDWRLNFRAQLELVQRCLPGMTGREWGRIIAIGSVQALRPNRDLPVYAALKAALSNLMRNLARDVGTAGVTVNTLLPGAIATDRNRALLNDPDFRKAVLSRIPLGEIGVPEDVAPLAALLCSDQGRYITGAEIPIDGGLHL